MVSTFPSVGNVFSRSTTAEEGTAFGAVAPFGVSSAVVTGRLGCRIGPTGARRFGGVRLGRACGSAVRLGRGSARTSTRFFTSARDSVPSPPEGEGTPAEGGALGRGSAARRPSARRR